ncbi:MAG: hypothetical protein ACYSTT_04575 [Planctomycetota bacterium]|jgi:hypothetical protein
MIKVRFHIQHNTLYRQNQAHEVGINQRFGFCCLKLYARWIRAGMAGEEYVEIISGNRQDLFDPLVNTFRYFLLYNFGLTKAQAESIIWIQAKGK